eukprot:Rmarinus@m.10120
MDLSIIEPIVSNSVESLWSCFHVILLEKKTGNEQEFTKHWQWQSFLRLAASRGIILREDLPDLMNLCAPTDEMPLSFVKIQDNLRLYYLGTHISNTDELMQQAGDKMDDFLQLCEDWDILKLDEIETHMALRMIEGLSSECLESAKAAVDAMKSYYSNVGDEIVQALFWDAVKQHAGPRETPFWQTHWGGLVKSPFDFQRLFLPEVEAALRKHKVIHLVFTTEMKQEPKGVDVGDGVCKFRAMAHKKGIEVEVCKVPLLGLREDVLEWECRQADAMRELILSPRFPAFCGVINKPAAVWFLTETLDGPTCDDWLKNLGPLGEDSLYLQHWGRQILLGLQDILRMNTFSLMTDIKLKNIVLCNSGARPVLKGLQWDRRLVSMDGMPLDSLDRYHIDFQQHNESDDYMNWSGACVGAPTPTMGVGAGVDDHPRGPEGAEWEEGGIFFELQSRLVRMFADIVESFTGVGEAEKELEEIVPKHDAAQESDSYSEHRSGDEDESEASSDDTKDKVTSLDKAEGRSLRRSVSHTADSEQPPATPPAPDPAAAIESEAASPTKSSARPPSARHVRKPSSSSSRSKRRRRKREMRAGPMSIRYRRLGMLIAMVRSCRTPDPAHRPRISDLLCHPCFQPLPEHQLSVLSMQFEKDAFSAGLILRPSLATSGAPKSHVNSAVPEMQSVERKGPGDGAELVGVLKTPSAIKSKQKRRVSFAPFDDVPDD